MAISKSKTTSTLPTVKVTFLENSKNTILDRSSPYSNNSFNFALCSRIKNGATKQLSCLIHCREGFIGQLINHHSGHNTIKNYSTERTTVLVWTYKGNDPKEAVPAGCKGPWDKWMINTVRAGVKLANHFEKECKWYKTKVYQAELPALCKSSVFIFEGSRWWSTSPQTLSLYLLLLRLAKREEIKKLRSNFKTEELTKLVNSFKDGMDSYNAIHADKWLPFLKNRNKLYGKSNFAKHFDGKNSHDGIRKLTHGSLVDEDLQRKFDALYRGAK